MQRPRARHLIHKCRNNNTSSKHMQRSPGQHNEADGACSAGRLMQQVSLRPHPVTAGMHPATRATFCHHMSSVPEPAGMSNPAEFSYHFWAGIRPGAWVCALRIIAFLQHSGQSHIGQLGLPGTAEQHVLQISGQVRQVHGCLQCLQTQ